MVGNRAGVGIQSPEPSLQMNGAVVEVFDAVDASAVGDEGEYLVVISHTKDCAAPCSEGEVAGTSRADFSSLTPSSDRGASVYVDNRAYAASRAIDNNAVLIAEYLNRLAID